MAKARRSASTTRKAKPSRSAEAPVAPPMAADDAGRIQLPATGEWVDYETYERRGGSLRVLDPKRREWLTETEFANCHPKAWTVIMEAALQHKVRPYPDGIRELMQIGMESLPKLRQHVRKAPLSLTWQEHDRRWQVNDPTVVGRDRDGDRVAVSCLLDVDGSWNELMGDLWNRARCFAGFVAPDDPPWKAEAVAVLRAAFYQHLVGSVVSMQAAGAPPPYPPAVLAATKRFADEARRYITTIAEKGEGMKGFEVMAGAWNLWDRAALARMILADVERWRATGKRELELAHSLVWNIRRITARPPTADEPDEATVKKIAAWLTLHAAEASNEKIAAEALRLLGFNPKTIFAATRRKEQRSRQAIRESTAERPPAQNKPRS